MLETLLQEWRRDSANKVLIFTKSVKLLDMLDYHLRNHRKESRELHLSPNSSETRIDYGFVRLDGSTKQEDREHAQTVANS